MSPNTIPRISRTISIPPAAYAPAGNTIPYTLTHEDSMLKFIA